MLNNFIRARQETGSYCGPSVMQMLLSQHEIHADQKSIVEACGATDTVMKLGIPLNALIVGVKKLFPELVVWQKSNATVEDINILVDKGYLVAFDWQGIFKGDEYRDDVWPTWWERMKSWLSKTPELKGDQGHYCIALGIDKEKGYLRFADPYGHYAGKDRYVALWEFEERWWDDRLDKDENGKATRILEDRLIFILTKAEDTFPASLGMQRA